MTEFTLNTSGAVPMLNPDAPEWALKEAYTQDIRWPDLSPFEQGYGGAMARELYERLIREGWTHEAALAAVAFHNWSPETLAAIRKDCADVQELAEFFADDPGASFWNNRQATWPAWATSRLRLMRRFPPLTITIVDDGKVYARTA